MPSTAQPVYAVARVVLKCSCCASCVQATDASALCSLVLRLLQQYAGFNQGRTSVAAAVQLRDEAAHEAGR